MLTDLTSTENKNQCKIQTMISKSNTVTLEEVVLRLFEKRAETAQRELEMIRATIEEKL